MRLHPSHLFFLLEWLTRPPDGASPQNISKDALEELFEQLQPKIKKKMLRQSFEEVVDLIISPLASESYSFRLPSSLSLDKPAVVDVSLFSSLRNLTIQKVSIKNVRSLSMSLPQQLSSLAFQYAALHDCRLLLNPTNDSLEWSKLSTLDLSHNALSNFPEDALRVIPLVTRLKLSHNLFDSIPKLVDLVHLRHLDVSYNLLESCAQIFLKVGMLTHLNIASNKISNLNGIDKLWALKTLDISKNLLTDIASLEQLALLPELEVLSIFSNPWKLVSYRKKVLSLFSKSSKFVLDGHKASFSERVQVYFYGKHSEQDIILPVKNKIEDDLKSMKLVSTVEMNCSLEDMSAFKNSGLSLPAQTKDDKSGVQKAEHLKPANSDLSLPNNSPSKLRAVKLLAYSESGHESKSGGEETTKSALAADNTTKVSNSSDSSQTIVSPSVEERRPSQPIVFSRRTSTTSTISMSTATPQIMRPRSARPSIATFDLGDVQTSRTFSLPSSPLNSKPSLRFPSLPRLRQSSTTPITEEKDSGPLLALEVYYLDQYTKSSLQPILKKLDIISDVLCAFPTDMPVFENRKQWNLKYLLSCKILVSKTTKKLIGVKLCFWSESNDKWVEYRFMNADDVNENDTGSLYSGSMSVSEIGERGQDESDRYQFVRQLKSFVEKYRNTRVFCISCQTRLALDAQKAKMCPNCGNTRLRFE